MFTLPFSAFLNTTLHRLLCRTECQQYHRCSQACIIKELCILNGVFNLFPSNTHGCGRHTCLLWIFDSFRKLYFSQLGYCGMAKFCGSEARGINALTYWTCKGICKNIFLLRASMWFFLRRNNFFCI